MLAASKRGRAALQRPVEAERQNGILGEPVIANESRFWTPRGTKALIGSWSRTCRGPRLWRWLALCLIATVGPSAWLLSGKAACR